MNNREVVEIDSSKDVKMGNELVVGVVAKLGKNF